MAAEDIPGVGHALLVRAISGESAGGEAAAAVADAADEEVAGAEPQEELPVLEEAVQDAVDQGKAWAEAAVQNLLYRETDEELEAVIAHIQTRTLAGQEVRASVKTAQNGERILTMATGSAREDLRMRIQIRWYGLLHDLLMERFTFGPPLDRCADIEWLALPNLYNPPTFPVGREATMATRVGLQFLRDEGGFMRVDIKCAPAGCDPQALVAAVKERLRQLVLATLPEVRRKVDNAFQALKEGVAYHIWQAGITYDPVAGHEQIQERCFRVLEEAGLPVGEVLYFNDPRRLGDAEYAFTTLNLVQGLSRYDRLLSMMTVVRGFSQLGGNPSPCPNLLDYTGASLPDCLKFAIQKRTMSQYSSNSRELLEYYVQLLELTCNISDTVDEFDQKYCEGLGNSGKLLEAVKELMDTVNGMCSAAARQATRRHGRAHGGAATEAATEAATAPPAVADMDIHIPQLHSAKVQETEPVSSAPLPTHLHAAPHAESVKAAVGIPCSVARGRLHFSEAPAPGHSAVLFTYRGSVYLHGGSRIMTLPAALQASTKHIIADMPHSARVAQLAIKRMGLTRYGTVVTAAGDRVPVEAILAARLPALPAGPAHQLVQSLLLKLQAQAGGKAPAFSQLESALLNCINSMQAALETLLTTAQPSSELHRLVMPGQATALSRLLLREDVEADQVSALQQLVGRVERHGAAAQWVSVPSTKPLPALSGHRAVTIPSAKDPRVLLISGSGPGQGEASYMQVHIMRWNAAGAVTADRARVGLKVSALRGFTADRLAAQEWVVLYGGERVNATARLHDDSHGFLLLHTAPSAETLYKIDLGSVVGQLPPSGPLHGHGSAMLRGGHLAIWGGQSKGSMNSTMYIATFLDSLDVAGTHFVPPPHGASKSCRFRVLVSSVDSSGVPPTPRTHAAVHRVPGKDALLVFGGQASGRAASSGMWHCSLASRAAAQPLPKWTQLAQQGAEEQAALFPLWSAEWRKDVLALPGSDPQHPSEWDFPRGNAATTMWAGRLVCWGGLQLRSAATTLDRITHPRALHRDFSTVMLSTSYAKSASRTSGGAGLHQFGLPAPVECTEGGLLSDTHVFKIQSDHIPLTASSMGRDLAWLWQGVAQAAVGPASGGALAIEPAAKEHGAAVGGAGADESGFSSAPVADLVLLCAAPAHPASEIAPSFIDAGEQPVFAIAAHRCIVACTVPWLHGALASLESASASGTGSGGFAAALHDDDEEDGHDSPLPPLPPSATLSRSVSVGHAVPRPALASPRATSKAPIVLEVPFAPVDAMHSILQYVYTGQATIVPELVPAVWSVCQCLGLTPEAKQLLKSKRSAAAKGGKGGKFSLEDKKWKHNVLLDVGGPWLPSAELPPLASFADCQLPLAAIDTSLSSSCEECLTVDKSAGQLTCSVPVSLGSEHRSNVNKRTVAGLRWLQSASAFLDMHLQVLEPETGEPMFLGVHAAVVAARSQVWRGALCSSMARLSDVDSVSLGIVEGIPLSLNVARDALSFVYGDVYKGVGVDSAPWLLPLAAAHGMGRLAAHSERIMVSGFDLDDPSSAVGLWAYGVGLGTVGRRICSQAVSALKNAGLGASALSELLANAVAEEDLTPEQAESLKGQVQSAVPV